MDKSTKFFLVLERNWRDSLWEIVLFIVLDKTSANAKFAKSVLAEDSFDHIFGRLSDHLSNHFFGHFLAISMIMSRGMPSSIFKMPGGICPCAWRPALAIFIIESGAPMSIFCSLSGSGS